ncbi:MAG: hypothetical protein AABP62_13695 [Planctomycetota bacterium]
MGATSYLMVFLFLCSSVLFVSSMISVSLAWLKGYRPWFWLVSLGPVGALLMLLQPNLNRATTPEQRERWEQRADWTGGILSGFTLFFGMALPILGMAVFFVSPMAVPTAPAMIAVPTPSIVDELVEMPAPKPQVSPAESAPEANSNQSGEPSVTPANDQPRVP